MRVLGLIAMGMVVAVVLAACAAQPAASGCSSCARMMEKGAGWCDSCNQGMLDGKEVKCASCFKGKTGETVWCSGCKKGYIGKEPMKCKGCYEAKKVGGTCMECNKKP